MNIWKLEVLARGRTFSESIGSSKKITPGFDESFLHPLELGALARGVGVRDLA
jgi:hypothetical protein